MSGVMRSDAGYDPNGKSPAEIERDIARTRSELGDTLARIEARLAPRRLIDLASDAVKDAIKANAVTPAGMVSQNKVPLVMLGAGLGWMLMTGGRPAREPVPLGAYARTKSAGFPRAAEGAGARVLTLVNDYPLAFGVLGGLIGAAAALALPERQAETLLDEAKRRVRHEAARLGQDAVDHAAEAAVQATDAAAGAAKGTMGEPAGDDDPLDPFVSRYRAARIRRVERRWRYR